MDKWDVFMFVCVLAGLFFSGFQFMQYQEALEEEGCRYYYETHVTGFEYNGGEFLNSTEYEQRKERRDSDYFSDPGDILPDLKGRSFRTLAFRYKIVSEQSSQYIPR